MKTQRFEFTTLKFTLKFHFFYEPEIIIRFSSKKCLDATVQTLKSKKVAIDVYSYPIPERSLDVRCTVFFLRTFSIQDMARKRKGLY